MESSENSKVNKIPFLECTGVTYINSLLNGNDIKVLKGRQLFLSSKGICDDSTCPIREKYISFLIDDNLNSINNVTNYFNRLTNEPHTKVAHSNLDKFMVPFANSIISNSNYCNKVTCLDFLLNSVERNYEYLMGTNQLDKITPEHKDLYKKIKKSFSEGKPFYNIKHLIKIHAVLHK